MSAFTRVPSHLSVVAVIAYDPRSPAWLTSDTDKTLWSERRNPKPQSASAIYSREGGALSDG